MPPKRKVAHTHAANVFCVKCKTKTPCVNPTMKMTANNRHMLKSSCAKCGTKKCMFVSKNAVHKGEGFFGDLLGGIANIGGAAGGMYLGQPVIGNVAGNVVGNLARKIPF